MPTVITIEQIYKSFNQHNQTPFTLENITATFTAEKTYAITGPSGCGKTTLLHMIALLIQPDKGTIRINQKDALLFSEKEKLAFFAHTIGIVFQQPYVLPELSVIENSMIPGLIQGKSRKECLHRATSLLEDVDLLPYAQMPIKTLSGGQQQRVVVARALFNKPAFLLMDEPTGSLDSHTALSIITLILSLHDRYNIGIIMCTHDKKIVELMDHCIIMQNNTFTRTEQ